MKFKIEVSPTDFVPWYMGPAYLRHNCHSTVYFIIPINWIVAISLYLYIRLRKPIVLPKWGSR